MDYNTMEETQVTSTLQLTQTNDIDNASSNERVE